MLNAGSSRNGILTTLRNLWSTMRRDVGSKSYNDLMNLLRETSSGYDDALDLAKAWRKLALDEKASAYRQSSRIEALEQRIERATARVTPGANATVRKIAAILRGDA